MSVPKVVKKKRNKRGATDPTSTNTNSLSLYPISPLTDNQRLAFEDYEDGQHLFLHGMAGTGKTYLSMYLALNDVLKRVDDVKKLVIVRSMVPTRDMGFLPGTQKEKMRVYEDPYRSICTELFDRGDAYDILKTRLTIDFISTSFVRGTTFRDCVVIVDETQNMSDMEIHSVMTRAGENCKMIFCGDFKQDDLSSERKKEQSGIRGFMKIIKEMDEFSLIEFRAEDIVRSGLVKSYIITRDKLGM